VTILAGELFYSDVAPYLPGTLVPISLPASAQPTRSPWPAHPGAAAGPPPTAVSDRSPAGTGEKRAALEALVDHIVPGRSADTRGPSEDELRITRIVRLPIDEASAIGALRRPNEEPEDLRLSFWGGVIPLRIVAGVPICDGRSPQDVGRAGRRRARPG
jgi:Pyridoxamine 5'-phosphate oxidase